MAEQASPPLSKILFEFYRLGNSVKVSAIDPDSNIEVSIVGDPGAGEMVLKRLAARKLAYVLAKRGAASSPGGG
jgi:hypothetical protein